ncbi:hypothetical protein KUM39_04360 [Streptomyces sp. J2-1]|uniref:hypothetical protein n=1 Tax=Streptomyces corallincola TaxID=2851888 RepID=UPI001C38B79E|nr:hypothetical protein [Streptomyces corallincola]MBV2353598.1 hypothetical protein [Streptomyces corallincola]
MDTERAEGAGEPEERAGSDAPVAGGGRRRSRTAVLSVATAVLLVGGGGAYLATADGPHDQTSAAGASGSTPPPLTLDDGTGGGTGAGTDGGAGGFAPGEPNPYGRTYTAPGTLPAGPDRAAVYAPRGDVGRDAVFRLAKALGVEGTPVDEGTSWRIGGKDGTGPVLRVDRTAPGAWTYSRLSPSTDNCRKVTACLQDPGGPAADPVDEGRARAVAAPVLEALGQRGARVDASAVQGAQRVVNADPVVDGLPTYGWTTGLTVDRKGALVGGHGMLSVPVKGATYPVLSARRTLALLNARETGPTASPPVGAPGHRMGIGGCAEPVPLKDRLEQPCGTGPSGSAAASATTVTKAEFGLAAHAVSGRLALVPSWLFHAGSGSEAFTMTHPAVDPAYLRGPSVPSGRPTPSGDPGTRLSDTRVEGYGVQGRELTVHFTGGACTSYAARARESGGRVTVRVTGRSAPGTCIALGVLHTKTVRLDAPLGGRKVVGTDGDAVPEAKPGPVERTAR